MLGFGERRSKHFLGHDDTCFVVLRTIVKIAICRTADRRLKASKEQSTIVVCRCEPHLVAVDMDPGTAF
jgi:hypothetical protein